MQEGNREFPKIEFIAEIPVIIAVIVQDDASANIVSNLVFSPSDRNRPVFTCSSIRYPSGDIIEINFISAIRTLRPAIDQFGSLGIIHISGKMTQPDIAVKEEFVFDVSGDFDTVINKIVIIFFIGNKVSS